MKQIDKNTVDSKNQLKKTEFVTFINPEGKGKRVMFIGNSITRHGVLAEIGWHNDYGMAASSIDNDYVHIVAREYSKKYPDAAFCICQVAEWERTYKDGSEVLELFKSARDFAADVMIMRAVENCPWKEFDKATFAKAYRELLDYLNPTKNAEIVLTTGFWNHPGDEAILEYAQEFSVPLIELGDLGEDDSMKAIGLFEHSGVANHPGDKGMRTIAERILEKIL